MYYVCYVCILIECRVFSQCTLQSRTQLSHNKRTHLTENVSDNPLEPRHFREVENASN